jgi:hypothetical protein
VVAWACLIGLLLSVRRIVDLEAEPAAVSVSR